MLGAVMFKTVLKKTTSYHLTIRVSSKKYQLTTETVIKNIAAKASTSDIFE